MEAICGIFLAKTVSVKNTFQAAKETHRYLIETISESFHPQVFLSSRFVKFHNSLLNCNKSSIRTIANFFYSDQRTVYGKNLSEIGRLCSCEVEEINPARVKQDMKYFLPPESEKWRCKVVHELVQVKSNKMTLEGFSNEEIDTMMRFLCTT